MTDDEKQAWRELLDQYLDGHRGATPRSLTVVTVTGTVWTVAPITEEPE